MQFIFCRSESLCFVTESFFTESYFYINAFFSHQCNVEDKLQSYIKFDSIFGELKNDNTFKSSNVHLEQQ